MRAKSFDRPPLNGKATHQGINGLISIVLRTGRQAGVLAGGDDIGMTEDSLDFQQINA